MKSQYKCTWFTPPGAAPKLSAGISTHAYVRTCVGFGHPHAVEKPSN